MNFRKVYWLWGTFDYNFRLAEYYPAPSKLLIRKCYKNNIWQKYKAAFELT